MVEADALGKLPDDYRDILLLLIPAATMGPSREGKKGRLLILTVTSRWGQTEFFERVGSN